MFNFIKILILVVFSIGILDGISCSESNSTSKNIPKKMDCSLGLKYEDFLSYYDKKIKYPENLTDLEALVRSYLKNQKNWDREEYLIKVTNKLDNVFQFLVVHKDDLRQGIGCNEKNTVTLDGGKSVILLVDPETMQVVAMYSA